MKYTKKPITIDAILWTGSNDGEVDKFITSEHKIERAYRQNLSGGLCNVIKIPTLEGVMQADPGDWIIKGIKGEFYPCKPDIFEATYSLAS